MSYFGEELQQGKHEVINQQVKIQVLPLHFVMQAVFDAFCMRWNLYGMQGDRPLVTKLSVNLTPHGTMIFIPAYWSFDYKRDVVRAALIFRVV